MCAFIEHSLILSLMIWSTMGNSQWNLRFDDYQLADTGKVLRCTAGFPTISSPLMPDVASTFATLNRFKVSQTHHVGYRGFLSFGRRKTVGLAWTINGKEASDPGDGRI